MLFNKYNLNIEEKNMECAECKNKDIIIKEKSEGIAKLNGTISNLKSAIPFIRKEHSQEISNLQDEIKKLENKLELLKNSTMLKKEEGTNVNDNAEKEDSAILEVNDKLRKQNAKISSEKSLLINETRQLNRKVVSLGEEVDGLLKENKELKTKYVEWKQKFSNITNSFYRKKRPRNQEEEEKDPSLSYYGPKSTPFIQGFQYNQFRSPRENYAKRIRSDGNAENTNSHCGGNEKNKRRILKNASIRYGDGRRSRK